MLPIPFGWPYEYSLGVEFESKAGCWTGGICYRRRHGDKGELGKQGTVPIVGIMKDGVGLGGVGEGLTSNQSRAFHTPSTFRGETGRRRARALLESLAPPSGSIPGPQSVLEGAACQPASMWTGLLNSVKGVKHAVQLWDSSALSRQIKFITCCIALTDDR